MSTSAPGASNAAPGFGTPLMDRINLYFRIRRYYKILTRRWYVVVLATAIGAGYSTREALNTPNLYRASSKVGIPPQVQNPFSSKAAVVVELNSFYETHLQYMQSTKVLDRVAEKMRTLRPGPPPAVLKATAAKGLGYFSMTVESTEFEYARLYALHWAREFMNYIEEITANRLDQSLADTKRDIERYERKLETARATLQDFQIKNNIASVKETADAAQMRLDNLLDEFTSIQTLRQRLENKTSQDLIKGGFMETPRRLPEKTAPDNAGSARPQPGDPLDRFLGESKYADTEFQLNSKEAEFRKLAETLKPKHPFLMEKEAELERLRRELKYQYDLIEEKRKARIESLKRDEESYKPIIDRLRAQVFESRGVQNEYERLKADEMDTKAELEQLRRAARALEASNTRENLLNILEEGVGSPAPVAPDRRKIIMTGVLFGLGAGLAIIFLLDRLDDRLELAEDIEAELGEPVLGQLPLLSSRGPKKPLLITRMDEHSMFAESIRVVRSAVMLGIDGVKKQVQVVTSAVPGDGKTTFTVNFAVTLAVAGHKVLLVDADMRRGNAHQFFDLERENGLSEILNGEHHWRDVLKQTEVPTLQLITTGRLPSNPGELLISPIARVLIEEASREFDYIIFDCPPLTAIDDTFALMGLADGILFVVRAGQTSMRFAKNTMTAVHQRGARIFGVVLNGITADNPYYYYNYYYHSYYSKGSASGRRMSGTMVPGTRMAKQRGSAGESAEKPAGTENNLPADNTIGDVKPS